MEEFLEKKYVLVKYENYDEYLKFMGLNYIKRSLAKNVKPVVWLIKNDDGTYTIEMTSTLANTKAVFTPGVEFDEQKPDGTQSRSIITFEGNKMTHIQKGSGKTSTHVREYFSDKMIMTTTAEGLDTVVTRVFELVK